MQVHKETIDKIPNGLPNRNNVDIEIYGMEGIPDADLRLHEKNKGPPEVAMTYPEAPQAPVVPAVPKPTLPPPPTTLPGAPNIMPPMGFIQPPPQVGPYGMMPPMPPMPPFGVAHNSQYPMPPIPGVPFHGAGPNPMHSGAISTTASAAPIPPKPLFPSVAGNSGATNASSNAAPSSSSSSTHGTIVTITATSRIVHPEEDLSLEELRIRLPKYKHLNLDAGLTSSQASNGAGNGNHAAPSQPPPPLPSAMQHAMFHRGPPPNMNMFPGGPPPHFMHGHPPPHHPFQQTFRPAY